MEFKDMTTKPIFSASEKQNILLSDCDIPKELQVALVSLGICTLNEVGERFTDVDVMKAALAESGWPSALKRAMTSHDIAWSTAVKGTADEHFKITTYSGGINGNYTSSLEKHLNRIVRDTKAAGEYELFSIQRNQHSASLTWKRIA